MAAAASARWARQQDGSWAVQVESPGGAADVLSGTTITVVKRNGETANVRLGACLSSWDSGTKAKYLPARKPRKNDNAQPLEERSSETYTVAVRVTNARGQWVEWALPLSARDEYLVKEDSFEIARCAVHVHDILTSGERTASPGPRRAPKAAFSAPAEKKPAPKKPSNRKAAA